MSTINSQTEENMMQCSDYVKLLKNHYQVKSDRALARAMNMSPSAVNFWANNTSQFSPEHQLRVAKILKIPPERIAADMNAMRCKDQKSRREWEKLGAVVSSLFLIINQVSYQLSSIYNNTCILCKIPAEGEIRAYY